MPLSYLEELENQSIYIIREAYKKFKNLAMLWSMGKDSTVILWLVRKAFFGNCPIPVAHIDTTFKMPEMIKYRDELAKKLNLKLIVGKNEKALAEGMDYTKGRLNCCTALKTDALSKLLEERGFNALFVGIRRDEEGTRAKERIFSPRDKNFEWNFKDQPPEFWDQFNTNFPDGVHLRVHPILNWTELDVWRYIKKENIPIIDLYYAKEGKRYRTIGCGCCTKSIKSNATNVDEIIKELEEDKTPERATRAQDQEDSHAMQKLRVRGYM